MNKLGLLNIAHQKGYRIVISFAWMMVFLAPHLHAREKFPLFAASQSAKASVENNNKCNHDVKVRILNNWISAYERFSLQEFIDAYHPDIVFRDPTAGVRLNNREQLRDFYRPIMQSRYGSNFTFDITHQAFSANSIAISGNFSLTYNGTVTTMPFATWLTLKDGKIKAQLDMFDYATMQKDLGEQLNTPPSEYQSQ